MFGLNKNIFWHTTRTLNLLNTFVGKAPLGTVPRNNKLFIETDPELVFGTLPMNNKLFVRTGPDE